MADRNGSEKRLLVERQQGQASGCRKGRPQERAIQLARPHPFGKNETLGFDKAQCHIRPSRAEPHEDAGDGRAEGSGFREAQAQAAKLTPRRTPRSDNRGLDMSEDRLHLLEKQAARFRQRDAPAGTAEQGRADLSLERFDLLAQRRLGDAKATGGPGEVQLLRHRPEIAEVTQFHSYVLRWKFT